MRQFQFLLFLSIISFSFSINKSYIYDIKFEGNENILSSDLKKILRLKEKSFFSTTEFKINKLNLDLLDVQSFYKSKGYLDVDIDYEYYYVDDYNISIVFIVSEGSQYKKGNIFITGNKSFSDEYILKLINPKTDYYNPIYIRNRLIDLKNEYFEIGKINVLINEEITKKKSSIDLQIDISEGKKFYINNISITGLEKVNQELVFRDLIFDINEIYNINTINQSRAYLFESQLFSSVEIFPYIDSDTTVNLEVRVRELRTREIEFEFGFSQLPSNQGDLPVSAINILGNIDRSNLFSTATKLSFRTEYGFSYSNENGKFFRNYHELSLQSPWFINKRIPFRLKLYNENISFNASVLGDRKLGIATYVETYRSSNPYLSFGLITDFFQSDYSNNRSIYFTYIKHNIKNFIQPSSGYYVSFSPRLNGTFLGGQYNYLKNDMEVKLFKNIFINIISATRLKIGYIYQLEKSNKESIIPEFDQFFLGGSSSLRGWANPMEYNEEKGSLSRVLFNSEIRIPIYKILGLEFFYDSGIVNILDSESIIDWNIGWGITILSGLGPARIDFAFKEGRGKNTIQVSLLNMF